ncbi:MAG: Nif3-like dinuclear metal center hexameric protein [Thermoleophilia bacterium]
MVADAIPGPVAVAGPPDAPVVRVAVCTGSGGSLIDAARAAGADVYVTGDLKHHDHDRAEGMALIDTSHAQLEQLTMRRWFDVIGARLAGAGVEARFSDIDTDPWRPATAR